jgi:8-oxo-dGTP pyrophosphatase MutT (NUDIX family)
MNDSVAVKAALLTEDRLSRTSEMRHPTQALATLLRSFWIAAAGGSRARFWANGARRTPSCPIMYVFPGGRRDPGDNKGAAGPSASRRSVTDKLLVRTQSQFGESAARGLAVAAAREMMEEAHLSLTPAEYAANPFARMSRISAFSPARSHLRAMPRRFDTRFFACFCDEVDADPADMRDSDELHDLTWLPIDRS